MLDQKARIRQEALAARRAVTDREARSRLVLQYATGLPEFAAAEKLLIYVDCRSEVQTRLLITDLLRAGRTVVVPWCRDDEHLSLFRLHDLGELITGRFGIPEPNAEQRADPRRRVDPSRMDLLLLPGVAFDRCGGRLGHGRGYFDRLLAETRPDAFKVGLAFECQVVADVSMGLHDVRMDAVVTEEGVYRVH